MIRPVRPDDVAALHALIVELARVEREPDAVEADEAMLAQALFGPAARVFAHVAETDALPGAEPATGAAAGAVVGAAIWYLGFSTWRGRHTLVLEDLVVRPEARGAGHGTALLRALASLCVERGYARLDWHVLDWNAPAAGFYRSIGAVELPQWQLWRLTDDALAAFGGG